MTAAQTRVLIVDDHPILRQGLSMLINGQSDLTVCAEAENGQDALAAIEAWKPHLAIIDISMRGMNGIELIKRIVTLAEPCQVIVLSMHEEKVYAERALRAGARGYVMKQDVQGNMLLAIRKVMGGDIWVSESMTTRLISKIVTGTETAASVALLTNRELEVLTLIGRGSSAGEIAEDLSISVRTVDSHREHIKKKLNLKNVRALILYAGEWVKGEGQ
jgi:DNA-binding NarL/FixJ family response regulator